MGAHGREVDNWRALGSLRVRHIPTGGGDPGTVPIYYDLRLPLPTGPTGPASNS